MIIAFSGLDGSGKTTCAQFALDYLKSESLNVKYVHVIRNSFYYHIVHNIVGRVSPVSKKYMEESLRKERVNPLLRLAKIIALFLNLTCFNIRYGRVKPSKDTIIITDRYFYDDIVQLQYLGLAGPGFISFYKSLIIKPDLLFFLKTDPQAAYARKDEYDRSYFDKKHSLYGIIYEELPNIRIEETDILKIKEIVRDRIRLETGMA